MDQEKRVLLAFREPESVSRKFKASCALRGVSIQDFLEQTARDLIEKEMPE